METLFDFSFNWNNKLDCLAFTTLRLSDRHAVGTWGFVTLKGQNKGRAVVVAKHRITVGRISPFIALLDTGYDVAETRAILQTMYPKNKITDQTPITLYLCRYETKKERKNRELEESMRETLLLSV